MQPVCDSIESVTFCPSWAILSRHGSQLLAAFLLPVIDTSLVLNYEALDSVLAHGLPSIRQTSAIALASLSDALGSVSHCPRLLFTHRPPPPTAGAVDTAALSNTQWHLASFPVEDFQAYTSPFGYRSDPYGGEQRFHYGLDMAAPSGSYIRNWWGGQVIEVSDDSSCGTSVVVQSGNWMHIYCHMQGYVTQEGGDRYMLDSEGGAPYS